jgi:hypothetical protein
MRESRMMRHGSLLAAAAAAAFTFTTAGSSATSRSNETARHGPFKVHRQLSDTSYASYNWSGYAVSGSVSDAKGSWTVPKVTCTRRSQYSSFWVGIDGFSSSTVEQIGTDSDCRSGRPTYYAWYEFYPNPMVVLGGVNPGDVISAEVTGNFAGSFTVSLRDNGRLMGPINGQVSNAQQSSAEWIAEAPSSSSGVLPLANFGKVSFGKDTTAVANTDYATVGGVTNPIGLLAPNDIMMVGERFPNPTKAAPSSLSGDGSSFTVTWANAGP